MFPGGRPPSIFSAKKLNYCVRNGNRCDLLAITTDLFLSPSKFESHLNRAGYFYDKHIICHFFRRASLSLISTEPITFVINISYDISFAEQA